MKVAVMNFSGNVGKTTVAAQLLKARMGDAPIYSVESLNVDASADGIEVEKLRGKRFGDLQAQLLELDSAIVDVGASNVEEFLKLMQQYQGSHEEFDYFVVPTVREKKQQADTVNTIRALRQLGIPAEKILLVFNKVDLDEELLQQFAPLFGLHKLEQSFTLNPAASIYANEVFERIKGLGKTLGEINADPTDYRKKLRDLKDENEREQCIRMIGVTQLAKTANRNLDDVWAALFQ